ncbi:unnamed protein product [Mycena citricolor]|uniref:Uncharacterized protein n=1 Tax=Mycena citricolor TaxID=2018698 RepID=A0AAD2HBX0_9AGAR|nr:unnamed protein product [Mycena citricolor]
MRSRGSLEQTWRNVWCRLPGAGPDDQRDCRTQEDQIGGGGRGGSQYGYSRDQSAERARRRQHREASQYRACRPETLPRLRVPRDGLETLHGGG